MGWRSTRIVQPVDYCSNIWMGWWGNGYGVRLQQQLNHNNARPRPLSPILPSPQQSLRKTARLSYNIPAAEESNL